MIERVVDAADRIKGVDCLMVLWAHNYPAVAEEDVLSRFFYAWRALPFPTDTIMRLTGDCPLLDPATCELVLASHKGGYTSNVYPKRTFPDGLDCEVFSARLLTLAHTMARSPEDREHVTPWMQRHGPVASVELPVDWSHVRLTLDTENDLRWLRAVVSR